ncbi:MAG: 4Fe-4S binding protein [Actinomycetia bacterium]|jgi:NADH-quinone oxidoreductase subunit I|nr:4Fe-4S binding protein [Actinomycetes bacterium]MCH9841148.1 4Fe-4S binding protein [Actinomycetes bacterium]
MLCVRECPAWCIELDSHTVEVTEEGARRPRKVNVLDSFEIDYSLCMYCGVCIDVCPFDALAWDEHRALVTADREDMLLGIVELRPSDSS